MTDTPKRKIIYSTTPKPWRTKRGKMSTVTLECGHMDTVNATKRRRGWLYCFDCQYGKPPSEMGRVICAEHGIDIPEPKSHLQWSAS